MAAAAAELPTPFRVVKRTRETSDTWTLVLEPESGEPLLAQPGQFTMLYAFGTGEVPISVSGVGGTELVHTVRAVGDVSNAICAARPGEVLGVRGPFGNAWPLAEAVGHDVIVVAGGIGLAPAPRSVAASAGEARRLRQGGAALRLSHTRRPSLHAGARALDDASTASTSTSRSTPPTARGAERSASSPS